MKDIIPTYSCVVAKEIDNNFYNNKIYIMFESTYESRKRYIDEAEAIIVGPHENEQKYIDPRYIGKIKSKGTYIAKYNIEKKVFEINNLEWSEKPTENNDEKFKKTLLKAHTIQQKYFNKDNLEHLDDETKLYFIEVQKINPYDQCNAYFKEKTLFYLNEYFNSDGSLIDKSNDFRYFKFKLDKNLFYDIKKELFFGEGIEEVSFTSRTYKENSNKLMRVLIKEGEKILGNDEICNNLGIKIEKKTSSEKLRAIKDYIRDFFNEKLSIENETFKNKILIAPGHKGFKLIGELLTNEEFAKKYNFSNKN